MTLECCNRMASELWGSRSLLDEASKDYRNTFSVPGSDRVVYRIDSAGKKIRIDYPLSVIYTTESDDPNYEQQIGPTEESTQVGFSKQYSIPKSEKTDLSDFAKAKYGEQYDSLDPATTPWLQNVFPGLYPTRMDMNLIFGLGQEHGKMKIAGKKERCVNRVYDSDTGEVRYRQPYFYPMYNGDTPYSNNPYGALFRDAFGSKVLRGSGSVVMEDGSRLNGWVLDEARRNFFSRRKLDGSEILYAGEPMCFLNSALPCEKETSYNLVGTINGDGAIHIFWDTVQYRSYTRGTRSYSLCAEGSLSLRISPLPDINTNEDNKDKYVEVLSITHNMVPGIQTPQKFRSPPQAIPLKRGMQYYVYAYYKDGRTGEHKNEREEYDYAGIGTYPTDVYLLWPKVF